MPHFQLQLMACVRQLDGDRYLAETAEFPEISCLRSSRRSALETLGRMIRRFVRDLAPADLIRRQSMEKPVVSKITIELPPVRRSEFWNQPVRLDFSLLKWSHPSDGWIVWVPALGIQTLAARESELDQMVPSHIKSYFQRIRDGVTLKQLVACQRTSQVRIVPMSLDILIRTPQQRQIDADAANEPKKSVLKEIATDMIADPGPETWCRQSEVNDIAMVLTGKPPRSVLLVGPSGVGKTAIVRELARQRSRLALEERRFWSTSGSRLVAGMSCFGMWQERCQNLIEESARSGAIVHLGSLYELMEVGQSESSGVGIAQFLRLPIIRGKLIAIAEATPEQFQMIERKHPELAQAFDVIQVSPPTPDECLQILTAVAKSSPTLPPEAGQTDPIRPILPEAIREINHLHRRFATYSSMPGRPLRFLKNLLNDRMTAAQSTSIHVACNTQDPPRSMTSVDVVSSFARETGLPLWLLDEHSLFNPDAAIEQLRRRVKGQEHAVQEIVEWLGLIKAQLIRPQRPLASLLFVGPTGVGKTELAKALAELLFGDEQRLTRFDMSEFSDPWSAQRLIGTSSREEGLLTSKVREQPFSVLLLDEFEKADSTVFDLLLQVLGEARLTDSAGRLADFTNAVIILTSNLGTESARRGKTGFVDSTSNADANFVDAVRQFLRPELFNRFDRIVSFHPLQAEAIREIAAMELDRLAQRDGLRFRLAGWKFTANACDLLARNGYDVRYGARPLKRVVERLVVAPVADKLLDVPSTSQVDVMIDAVADSIQLEFRSIPQTIQTLSTSEYSTSSRVTSLQSRAMALSNCPSVHRFQNELTRSVQLVDRENRRMLKRTAMGKPWSPPREHASRQKIVEDLKSLLHSIDELNVAVSEMEDRCWLGILQRKSQAAIEIPAEEVNALECDWRRLAMDVYCRQFTEPDRAVVAVFGADRPTIGRLAAAYRDVCQRSDWTVREWVYAATQPSRGFEAVAYEDPDDGPLFRKAEPRSIDYENLPEHVVGIGLEVAGPASFASLHAEEGCHRFRKDSVVHDGLVIVSTQSIADFQPPALIGRRNVKEITSRFEVRRTYNVAARSTTDEIGGESLTLPFHPDQLGEAIARRIEIQLGRALERLLVSSN